MIFFSRNCSIRCTFRDSQALSVWAETDGPSELPSSLLGEVGRVVGDTEQDEGVGVDVAVGAKESELAVVEVNIVADKGGTVGWADNGQ